MTTLDLAGIGIGPFNLGLASLLSSHPEVCATFLERKPGFRWHEGLILPGTTLQVPFLADLVSMADPTNKLSFLNYLAAHDRLYKFYFYENFLIPRQEYDDYCRWASQQLSSCRFGESVVDVRFDRSDEAFITESRSSAGASRIYRSKNIVVGIGTSPYLPKWTALQSNGSIYHSAEFAKRKAELMKARRVTVVGSGQSAAECVLALFSELTPEKVAAGASIRWITRSAGFFPMEYSKLGLEYFTPDYMREFHKLPRSTRRQTVADQGLLYKGISFSTIADIYDLLYERSIGGRDPGLSLSPNCEVKDVKAAGFGGSFKVALRHNLSGEESLVEADAIVAATGYRHAWPEWIESLKGQVLETCEKGDLIVEGDFRARRCDGGDGAVFVQNAETFQHGVGAPDLGLGAYRNASIINQLLGRQHYRVNSPSAFQNFGVPSDSSAKLTGDIYARAI
ncbi:putative histamine N-monooxygenase [Agrobacterium larrymoorei]|uniref:Histamine N-monooxygenase n=1 Tax=Agrobacterium larrymoorei TaxID=160699 RepID=A0A4D7DS62_9HYPH|nr:putative histamine N-monooxygenase [Agrobacterium larrymoorei]QCI99641.1 putative histamine N-monooxygenase [Agrobacterium larrymoorei]QYA09928.1 putative histamine N-monooxygenase [Agrobacterium larrymoorei]